MRDFLSFEKTGDDFVLLDRFSADEDGLALVVALLDIS